MKTPVFSRTEKAVAGIACFGLLVISVLAGFTVVVVHLDMFSSIKDNLASKSVFGAVFLICGVFFVWVLDSLLLRNLRTLKHSNKSMN